MRCEEARSALSAFADGELSSEDSRDIRAHIDECLPCRDALIEIRQISRALTAEGRQPMPPALRRRIDRALDAAESIEFGDGTNYNAPRAGAVELIGTSVPETRLEGTSCGLGARFGAFGFRCLVAGKSQKRA